jgi:hypothetical protein
MTDSKTTNPHNFTGAEIDTLRKLARAYPAGVDAGDIPSKGGRVGLMERGFAYYDSKDGVTYLTREGLVAEMQTPPPPGSRSDRADRARGGVA